MAEQIFKVLKKIPDKTGVYFFKDPAGRILYIGKAVNLRKRLAFYRRWQTNKKISWLVAAAEKIEFLTTDSELEALLLEMELIKKFRPAFNVIWKDDKRPLYIGISGGELPRVFLTRKTKERSLTLYGPFPSSYKARSIYKLLRQVFTFCQEENPTKPCFYSHLGLCSPCPGYIKKLTGEKRREKTRQYRQQIRQLKKVLAGRVKPVLQELNRQVKKASLKEDFQLAGFYKKRWELVNYLRHYPASLDQYLTQPAILSDIGQEQMRTLADFLQLTKVVVIEGYDIAHISGQFAVGSLVSFRLGLPDKNSYRRFRIKNLTEQNDTLMLQQVLSRRLQHKDWPLPDVLLVDGGKAQVAALMLVLQQHHLSLPVVGLSKQREEIILKIKEKFVSYNFSSDSPILQLLQKIRDEAHRFATSYYKNLHQRFLLQ